VGAALLFIRFVPGREVVEAAWLSIFHAVSAFCNAGFALFSDNLMGYRGDWLVNLVIDLLIVSGGIGFMVMAELRQAVRRDQRGWRGRRGRVWRRLSVNAKLVLTTTAVLIGGGTLLILLLEWNNTLRSLPLDEKFLAALFQSVTARTAGFNTVNIGGMLNASLFVLILLMFIGASSGSCGGGVKTGTFAVLVVWGLSRLQGKATPEAHNRSITDASLGKAIAVVIVSTFLVTLVALSVMMTEIGSESPVEGRGKALEILFETVSGFGTVGLSTGITPTLSWMGKFLISIIMLIGRLGPLVIALAVSRRSAPRIQFAQEGIMIG
jgi:trk system potassium uptake protein TrkH